MKQVITIRPDGSLEGLQRKKGQGLDLRQFGKAKIERVSEIVWDEDYQKWFIHVLNYRTLRQPHMEVVGIKADAYSAKHGVALFNDYDDAVAAEVTFLDWCRLEGLQIVTGGDGCDD